MKRTTVSVVGMWAFLLILLALPAHCAAADTFSVTVTPSLPSVQVSSGISIGINITNVDCPAYPNLLVVVYAYPSGSQPDQNSYINPYKTVTGPARGKFANVDYNFSPKKTGNYSVTVKLYNSTLTTASYLYSQEFTDAFKSTAATNPPGPGLPLPLEAIVGIVVVLVVVIAAVALMVRKKKKPVDKPIVPLYTGPTEPQRMQGKFPKDYYKFRREKLARLKPVGLTASGICIMGNPKSEIEADAKQDASILKVCPKCCTPQEPRWKMCKNCSAKTTIEEAYRYLAKLGADGAIGKGAENRLEGAQAALDARNYDEAETYAHDVLDRAKAEVRRAEDAKKIAEITEGPHREPPEHSGMMESVEPTPVVDRNYLPEDSGPSPGYSELEQKTRGSVDPSKTHEYSAGSSSSPGYEPVSSFESGPVEAVKAYGEPEAVKSVEAVKPVDTIKVQKKEPNPCWKCSQGLRPEWKKCPYCDSPQEGVCGSCGKTVKMKWKVCPHCSADMTATKPKMACPNCGTELAPSGECQSCKAKSMLDRISRLVKESKSIGADLTEAEALIGRGELAIKIKNFDKAIGHFQKVEDICQSARISFLSKKAKERIDNAETMARDSAEEGADVSQPEKYLLTARMMMNEKRFEEAEQFADKASKAAAEALREAMEAREAAQSAPQPKKRPFVVGAVKVKPRCPGCQEQVEEEWPMCPFCSRQLTKKCIACGANVRTDWKVCPACEAPQ